jgi:L-alanine-DL-glutamate epimerase-like enolase superfamily enzyme
MARLIARRESLPLRRPLRAAWGELRSREIVRLAIEWQEADWGDGEAAPLEPYDGVPTPTVLAALDAYGTILARADRDASHAELLEACRAERDLPQALAAVDLAMWDRAARRSGKSVAELLASGTPATVPVNATIGAEDAATAAAQAAAARDRGFRCLKVKVGIGDDARRLAAVRAAVGRSVAIRADANGAWSTPEEALANLRALAPVGLEMVEEPIHGLDGMHAVRAASPVPIAMDETAAEPGALRAGAADYICLKIARCGGISGVLEAAAIARESGAHVYVSSSFDGPLGIAAALHAAAALRTTGDVAPCGLATLDLFSELPDMESAWRLQPRDGAMPVPDGPGLLAWR